MQQPISSAKFLQKLNHTDLAMPWNGVKVPRSPKAPNGQYLGPNRQLCCASFPSRMLSDLATTVRSKTWIILTYFTDQMLLFFRKLIFIHFVNFLQCSVTWARCQSDITSTTQRRSLLLLLLSALPAASSIGDHTPGFPRPPVTAGSVSEQCHSRFSDWFLLLQ